MKKILYIGCIATAALLMGGCKKMLVEKPHGVLTPEFYKTSQGLKAGLDAAYAGTRTIWGNEDYFSLTTPATDEWLRGNDGNKDLFLLSTAYQSTDGKVTALWNNCYTYINSCNAVIENAPNVTSIKDDLKARMVGEAKFLRANYYFVLVQLWGDVTLSTKFNTEPLTSAKRDPMAAVYANIIQDLKEAMAVLPKSPSTKGVDPGRATLVAAQHVLAKVYLTRAGSSAKQPDDYQNAYTNAIDIINNAGALGVALLPDFANVFAEGNENSAEVLWAVQHTSSLAYNGSPNQDNRTPDNMLVHLFVPQYEKVDGMQRDILGGRPYIRTVPSRWLTDTVFAERKNDTRFAKTFQTVWYCNNANSIPKWPTPLPPGAPAGAVAGGPKFKLGDTAIYLPMGPKTAQQIAAAPYTMIPSDQYNSRMSPALMKYIDTKRSDMNAPSIRPVIAYRLAETYLIAAEALMMAGRTADAVPYINAVRERAAYPTGNKAAMDITAADLNLDFILDERSRELAGENVRWLDLARTGQLEARIKKHNTECRANFQSPKHLLRPIPLDQINAVTTGPAYGQNKDWL